MTVKELYEKTLEAPGSVTIRLTAEGANCFEEGPDANMTANVMAFSPAEEDPDSVFCVILDFSPYRAYNEKVAKTDWYIPGTDMTGATWFSSGHYPENGIVTGYISASLEDSSIENAFTIVKDPSTYMFNAVDAFPAAANLQSVVDDFWKQMKLNYPEWDEAALKRAKKNTHMQTYMFPQMWGSTALGFDAPGTIGGCAMTEAQTFVLYLPEQDAAVVYFGSRFAYMVQHTNDAFWEDMHNWNLVSVMSAKERY